MNLSIITDIIMVFLGFFALIYLISMATLAYGKLFDESKYYYKNEEKPNTNHDHSTKRNA